MTSKSDSISTASVTGDKPVPLAELLKQEQPAAKPAPLEPVKEIGGRRDGPEPTRYGDWEKNGRCVDF